jgi:hypothetical protein
MNRVLWHCLAGLSVLCGGIALTSACAHDDSSFFVQGVIYPQPQNAATGCTYTANPNQIFQSTGRLDLGFLAGYSAVFLLADQLVSQQNTSQLQTETDDINVEGAIVRDTDSDGNQLDSFTADTSGTIYASTGNVPGYAVISAQIVSEAAVKALAAEKVGLLNGGGHTTIETYVKFFGKTLGGDYTESNEFDYPIDVCTSNTANPANASCLLTFSASDQCSSQPSPNCGNAATSSASSQNAPCIVGEDTPVDCSLCYLKYSFCNPNPPPAGGCDGGAG